MLPCHIHFVDVGSGIALQEGIVRILENNQQSLCREFVERLTTPLFVSSAAMA